MYTYNSYSSIQPLNIYLSTCLGWLQTLKSIAFSYLEKTVDLSSATLRLTWMEDLDMSDRPGVLQP